MTTGLDYKQNSVLEILKNQTETTLEAIKTLDDKAQQNTSIYSLIIAIIASFEIKWSGGRGSEAHRLFVCIFITYGLLFILTIWGRLPRKSYAHPINTDTPRYPLYLRLKKQKKREDEAETKIFEDEIKNHWLNPRIRTDMSPPPPTDEVHYYQLIKSYIKIIRKNKNLLRFKLWISRWTTFSTALMMFLIAILVISSS